jgi:translation initiation factor 1
MADIFDVAGLPDELEDFDALDEIAREQTELRITTDSRRYGKLMTIVTGVDDPTIQPKKLLSVLKSKCACGGAYKDGHIELQGDHRAKVRAVLESMGFIVQSE